jgi:nucleoside-diphosphate-sugar epimerase
VSTCLVTGGSGYFGSLVVARLLERGHRVRVLDLNDTPDRPPEVEFVRGDIRDRLATRTAVDGCDLVFHNVAQVPLARDPHLLRTVNVDGTRLLLDACLDAAVDKVVHTSSSAIFGVPDTNPVMPHTTPRPGEAYGHAKLQAEWACLEATTRGLDVSLVRPRTILGHGRLGIFGILFDWIADGADPFVLGDGTNRYQFVHADDLAEVCILESEQSGPAILNAGTDRFGTMREALQHLCEYAGTGARVRSIPAAPAAIAMRLGSAAGMLPFAPYHWMMYAQSMWFDVDHVRDRLGWVPRWSNDEMFAESYDWFCANRTHTTDATASHHRRSARQGALTILKRSSHLAPLAR